MRPNETLYVSINQIEIIRTMTVDGQTIIISFKEDSIRHTVTFYNKDEQPEFYTELEEPIARIRHILPVRLNYVFDGKTTRAVSVLPL